MDKTPIKDLRTIAKEAGILDEHFIMEAINDYNQGKFDSMHNIIQEYGATRFFIDLYVLFDKQPWRSAINKYLTFVGLTIEYFKYENLSWKQFAKELEDLPGIDKFAENYKSKFPNKA